MNTAALRAYTRYLLPWRLGNPPAPAPVPGDASAHLERLLRAVHRTPREHVLLLGFGNGALASGLARTLPPQRALTVCTLDPESVRQAATDGAAWWEEGRHCVLADTSPRALLLLLHAFGRDPARCTLMLNPELPGRERIKYQDLQRLLLSTERLEFPELPSVRHARPLSAAAILHPEEPELPAFFAQFPSRLHELIVIWDADAPPPSPPDAACPVRHLARRLRGDFAAQRNAALTETGTEWVVFLDGDERFGERDWEELPALVERAGELGAGGVAWPRMTLWPDSAQALAGFGLWPDLQLRLLRKVPSLCFERPVHEVATGLAGPILIDAGRHILHLSRILKDQAALAAKLRIFDAAAGHGQHRLNEEYPALPVEFLRRIEASFAPGTLLRLR